MIPTPPKPKYEPGTHVRVIHSVRVGHQSWKTKVTGTVESEGLRPIGGMEMGGKARFTTQPTLRIRKEDGEVTVVAIDEETVVETIS